MIAAALISFAGAESAHAATTAVMGFAEGEPAAAACRPGQYLAGFNLWYDNSMSGLSPYCVAMAQDGGWEGAAAIDLNSMMGPARSGANRVDMFCPRDFYAFGFKGHSHVYGIHSIIQLTLTCRNVKNGVLSTIGTNYPNGVSGTEWPAAQCSDDSVATGTFGRVHDALIIQFGLSCGMSKPAALQAKILAAARSTGTTIANPSAKSLGRVAVQPGYTPSQPRPICDVAREARARNSPAAAGLEAQCLAAGGAQPPATAVSTVDLDVLAAKGAVIANADPLSRELRNRMANGPSRRGFDIGMAAAEGNTAPGPGKQRIHDALGPVEQGGFDVAVSFSLQRNRNAAIAATGAAIAGIDPVVAQARVAEADVFYWLGFDIASGIFGDPALGALGNTATGPGSLGIRDALNAAGQRGFNASVSLHLSRNYRR